MLLSSIRPLKPVYSFCHDLSPQLLRYLDENIHHAHCSVPDNLTNKYPVNDSEKEL
jgi:hypothetical protein